MICYSRKAIDDDSSGYRCYCCCFVFFSRFEFRFFLFVIINDREIAHAGRVSFIIMNKRSTTLTPLKRPSTRSLSTVKSSSQPSTDKYTFQSDDEDHQTKPVLNRKSLLSPQRSRGRPTKKAKNEQASTRKSASPSDLESESEIEEQSSSKRKRSGKSCY